MKGFGAITIVLLAVAFMLSANVNADVPRQITYQGVLSDSTGAAVPDAPYLLKFIIWDDPTATGAGNEKWNSGFQTVNPVGGLFSYDLGSNVALPDDLFATDTSRWLGITVGTDSEISPRTKLNSQSYSYEALRADTAGVSASVFANSIGSAEVIDNSLTASDLAAGSVGTSEVADNSLTANDLAAGSVGTSEVADNSLTANDLAAGSVGTSEVADNSLTANDLAAGSVGSSEVADNSLTASDLASGSVGTSELASGAVFNVDVNAGAAIAVSKISGTAVNLSSSQTISGSKTFNNLNISTTTRYIVVPGTAFSPEKSTDTYTKSSLRYYIHSSTASSNVKFMAPINLPHGATITKFEGYFMDNTANNATFRLRIGNTSGGSSTVANMQTSGASTAVRKFVDNTIFAATVDNVNKFYYLQADWTTTVSPSAMKLYGVRVWYTITKPLP